MARRDRLGLSAVRTEGAILPPSILARIHREDPTLGGLKAEDYALSGTKIREAASQAWNALQGPWRAFQAEREKLAPGEAATGMTRRRWLDQILKALDYGTLDPLRESHKIGDREYPISHRFKSVPIHLVGCGLDLDKRTPGAVGASKSSPHGLIQLYLNAEEKSLWGFVSNGLKWRILRDSVSLSRQAMVEFDLEAIFEGQLYDEFLLFYLVAHPSRVKADRPEECWLEKWSQAAGEEGKRALNTLRGGVEKAIVTLGQGFLRHPANRTLKESLREGSLDKQDYYRQLLRMVYRLLFLFVAEDRGLLLRPNTSEVTKRIFTEHYGTQRLRLLAEKLRGSRRHHDLYLQLRLVLAKLGEADGCPELGLPALGGFLFSGETCPELDSAELSNADLLEAIRCLAVTEEDGRRSRVDYKNLASEEMGSVYESLLELHPDLRSDGSEFVLLSASGNERKTTGSYYTPDSLIQCLLDSALEPVIAQAIAAAGPDSTARSEAILKLRVIDPAVGSGHFLIAAGHRMAKHLAQARSGEDEPGPEAMRSALREIIGACLFGIDINPMSAELCKVALWMESLEPGKPLGFLDHHIVVGNSLLGATPEMLKQGIPDAAYDSMGDPQLKAQLKRQNREDKKGQDSLFFNDVDHGIERAAATLTKIDEQTANDLKGVHQQEKWYYDLIRDREFERQFAAADLFLTPFLPDARDIYLSAFVGSGITTQTIRRAKELTDAQLERIREVRVSYRFLHPHRAFPQVFADGGFDVVIGNPPWERVKLQEKEFFAGKDDQIVNAPNAAARRKLIEALSSKNPRLYRDYQTAKGQAEGESAIMRLSGRFPLAGRGDINTYAVFAELFRSFLKSTGRAGIIVPSGIATDDTTKFFFGDLMDNRSLASLYDFENGMRDDEENEVEDEENPETKKPTKRKKRSGSDGDRLLFASVDSRFKFSLLTMTGSSVQNKNPQFAFFCHRVTDLLIPGKSFNLTPEDIALLNPNTKTCPVFRSQRDAEITKKIYQRVPILIKEGDSNGNPWGISFGTMFHMSNDSGLFRTREEMLAASAEGDGNVFLVPTDVEVNGKPIGAGPWVPLYEAKMFHQFDHRFASADEIEKDGEIKIEFSDVLSTEKNDPTRLCNGRYWVQLEEVLARTGGAKHVDTLPERERERERERETVPSHLPRHRQSDRFSNAHIGGYRTIRTGQPASGPVEWMMIFRDIVRATDVRTTLLCLMPSQYGLGHTGSIVRMHDGELS